MKKLVVGSSQEIASMNIIEELDETLPVKICESGILELEEVASERNTLLIVASPHSSSKGVLSLSVHTTGNFGEARFGGDPQTLSIAPALYLGNGLRKMKELAVGLPHEVTLEVTHHGPTFQTPMMWVEIGSNLEGWKDKRAAKVAAKTIEYLFDLEPSGDSAIGIGGPHYAPNFTKHTLRGSNFGHICPKYAIQDLDEEMITQMIEKTSPRPEKAVLDWKGIPGGKRQELEKILSKILPVEKI